MCIFKQKLLTSGSVVVVLRQFVPRFRDNLKQQDVLIIFYFFFFLNYRSATKEEKDKENTRKVAPVTNTMPPAGRPSSVQARPIYGILQEAVSSLHNTQYTFDKLFLNLTYSIQTTPSSCRIMREQ